MRHRVRSFLVLSSFLFCSVAAGAQAWPYLKPARVAGGFVMPVHVTHANDGSGRLFVVEQPGRIRIVRIGSVEATPFLDITSRVTCCGESGLLSVAFPPDYPDKDYFYVYYMATVSGQLKSRVARFHLTADPDVADPDSEEILLTLDQPFPNHNGGQLAFGPDGYLYVSLGDGGSGGDPGNRAQNPATLLGKILRIDVESGVSPYAVPSTNPFVGQAGYLPEIWALGLRNPWRLSFDRQDGHLWIGDVGQGAWEEINFQPSTSGGGENYGWRIMEGAHCFNPPSCSPAGLQLPAAEYHHSVGGCSVTGGVVHRNPAEGSLFGIYFFGDYCTGFVWGLRPGAVTWELKLLLDSPFFITSFGEDEAGHLYLASHIDGSIYQLRRRAAPADLDGDGTSDLMLYRAGAWHHLGPCVHLLSEEGSAVDAACSPCAATVCNANPSCCSSAWSASCVNAVEQLCR